MTFIDGTATHEQLAHQTPSAQEVRKVVKALIGTSLTPDQPITDTDRQNAHLIAEAVGLLPTTLGPNATYRDPITGTKRKRTSA